METKNGKKKKQNTSIIISKGSPNYVKDIQEPYPVLNISPAGSLKTVISCLL